MPIRTNRGRAAVYRKLWAWPLRSPRHLVMATVLLVVVASVVGFLLPQATDNLGSRRARPTVTVSNGTTVTLPAAPVPGTPSRGATSTSPVPRATTPTPSPAAAAPEALAVADAWARAWVNHPAGMTNDDWVAQLAPLTTEEYLPQLRSVELANIPSTTVTGKAEPINAAAAAVDVRVTTDGATLLLTVIATESGWRVSAFDRVD
ncbi:MAG TPA: hypothetical protein VGD67_09455 [Pseudonocardiaceae bacterium]